MMPTGAVIIWLLLAIASSALYYTSSGKELLLISTESWLASVRLWLGQTLLIAAGFGHFLCVRNSNHPYQFQSAAAVLAVIPSLALANAFRLTAIQFEATSTKTLLFEYAAFYALFSITIGLCLSWADRPQLVVLRRLASVLLVALPAIFPVVAFFPTKFGTLLGPELVVALAASTILGLYYVLNYYRARLRSNRIGKHKIVRTLLRYSAPLLAIWFLVGLAQNTHEVRNLAHDRQSVQDYSHWRLSLDDSLDQWYVQHKGADGVALMFLVESAGGGARAAYWTTSVFTALDDRVEGFRRHLFAISAVSGGGLGATLYRAAIRDNESGPPIHKSINPESFKAFFRHDFLGPLAAGWLFSDLASTFFPIGLFPDRAEALERSWENAWAAQWHSNEFSNEFRLLWPKLPAGYKRGDPLPSGRWPHLILNGSSLDRGTVIITADVGQLGFGNQQFPRVQEMAPLRFPTSTAANNSARFPVLEPPGMVVVRKRTLQEDLGLKVDADAVQDLVVDGGYVDNFGSYALAYILDHVQHFNCQLALRAQLQDANKPLDTSNCNSFYRKQSEPGIVPVIIQITSDPDMLRTAAESCGCLDAPAAWQLPSPGIRTKRSIESFTEVLAPVIELDRMRQRSGITFSSALPTRPDVQAYFHFGLGIPYPKDGKLHRSAPAPSLNWGLSRRSMQQIEEYLAQCDHLQTEKLIALIKEPKMAAENSKQRRVLAFERYSTMSSENMHPFCR